MIDIVKEKEEKVRGVNYNVTLFHFGSGQDSEGWMLKMSIELSRLMITYVCTILSWKSAHVGLQRFIALEFAEALNEP